MLRPINKGAKRCGLLKVAPRIQGKIMETEAGNRFMIVEQKGRDVWRGRYKTLHEALEADAAGVGVDRILLARSKEHGVSVVMVVIEEQRRIFVTTVDHILDGADSTTRANYQGRATRILNYRLWVIKKFGPDLHRKRKRVTA